MDSIAGTILAALLLLLLLLLSVLPALAEQQYESTAMQQAIQLTASVLLVAAAPLEPR
jgi:hypothetical protein